ncbi:hypothetical protein C2R22_24610 (plasmid) [Salinigranum rubrum]|uniref:Uncharacterized protein n=1 Tax=Salinigranum rubrum TaxID=755307 RepID=A0A2I8VS79_9EURY|nr:hypothetical protein C2R22_24610 [Salinigranum rubrum]
MRKLIKRLIVGVLPPTQSLLDSRQRGTVPTALAPGFVLGRTDALSTLGDRASDRGDAVITGKIVFVSWAIRFDTGQLTRLAPPDTTDNERSGGMVLITIVAIIVIPKRSIHSLGDISNSGQDVDVRELGG